MTDSEVQLIVGRLDNMQDDITYIRSRVDDNSSKIADLQRTTAEDKGARRVVKFAANLIVPAIIALICTGATLALTL